MTKTILVTGASGSIGKELALELAQMGHRVLLHGRNPEKTRKVFESIKEAVPDAQLEMYTADLSEMANVSTFAKEIQEKHEQLDVLINNAGGQFGSKREETSEGHEKTFAINVLAPFLLTKLLLPQLDASANGRVVTVSSASFRVGGKPMLNDFELRNHYSIRRSYGLSKLYVWWIMRQFVANYSGNVTFNTFEPGSTPSDLGRISGAHGIGKLIDTLWQPFTKSADISAAPGVLLATDPALKKTTGEFYSVRKEPMQIKDKWFSAEGEERLWQYCEQVCLKYLDKAN